jgi:hypothetical protein
MYTHKYHLAGTPSTVPVLIINHSSLFRLLAHILPIPGENQTVIHKLRHRARGRDVIEGIRRILK